ncbi:ATP10 protein-domain-containing protein [Trametes polyzona]|nr:ATP10 protein-domain-containing protein [Trametes polyzona]
MTVEHSWEAKLYGSTVNLPFDLVAWVRIISDAAMRAFLQLSARSPTLLVLVSRRGQYRLVSSSPSRRAEPPSSPNTGAGAAAESQTKAKAPEASVGKSAKKDDAPLPLLQRPLGVHDRPQAKVPTKEEAREKYLDHDKRMEERTHLAREATRGYFADLSATRRHGGKTWIAPKVMIRQDKALYFPDIYGTPLVGKEKVHTTNLLAGKVSVVTLLTTRISEIQTAQFIEPTQASFADHPLYQRVQINLQDNLIKSFLVSLFASGIRKTIPESLWPTYLISSQNMEYLREPLGIANRHVGYVYLVDPTLKIRWAGCADPKAEEIAALRTCTSVLLDRSAKEQEASSGASAQPSEKLGA